MGQANSYQPTDYQVESSERVTVFDCTFKKLEPDNVEHVLAHQSTTYFYKFCIRFSFSVNLDPELLRVVFTRDPLFDTVAVGQSFPLKRSSDLKTGGVLEEIGYFSQIGPCNEHSCELFIPKNLAERRLCGFLLDGDDVVVAKARGIVAFEDEFAVVNKAMETTERASRAEGLSRLAQLENELTVQNAFTGITETLKALLSVKKSKVEFIEARDSTRLAYRTYHSQKSPCSAILILLAGNSHFHDIIASRLASSHPITVYIFEIRGFGYSGGKRGGADSQEQIYGDIRTFVRFIKMNNLVPVFLGGHYRQGGLLLNYGSWPHRETVDGYVFVSPFMGAGVEKPSSVISQNLLSESLDHSAQQYQSEVSYSALTSIADVLFGREQEYHLFLTEIERELNPMIVDQISATVMKAYTPSSPKKQFELLDRPFGFWVGEKEELLVPERLIKYPQKAKILNSVNMLPGLTHMGVFNDCHLHIGNWIMNLETVNTRHLNLALNHQAILSSDNGCKHSLLRDVDIVIKSYCDLGLNDGKQSFLLSNDGAQIPYRIFTSKNRPLANLILLQADIKVVLAYILIQKCDLAVYVMDLRGVDNASVCATKDSLLKDTKCMVRHLKFNYPEMPLLLGGHGFGASVALSYSNWTLKESVNAYLFLSPIIDPESKISTDMKVINKQNMEALFSRNQSSGFWIYPKIRRSYSSASSMTFLSQMRLSSSTSELSLPDSSAEQSSLLWEALICKNLRKIISEIDVPFGFWIGSDDELSYGSAVIDMVTCAKSKVAMRQVALVPHTSHVGNVIVSSAYLVPFIKQLVKVVAPSLSFKIRNAALDDFERLDFIGKGSFGRVYLVKHKLSEKYFAMKVLSKKEIVEAKEVNHIISERNILKDLNSSFAASFVGSFQNPRSLYILMEFIIGGELYTQLCLKKRFSEDSARFYAAGVLLFFEDIHAQNIIYRDLKPENILLDAMGHIKLVDFGFSKYIMKNKTFTFCGTPQYIAPEVLMNSESRGRKTSGYGIAVDYYSLGILIYEMLVGNTPFYDKNVRAIYRKVLYGAVEFPKWIDPVAKDLISSLICRDPNKRLGSAPAQSVETIKKHRWFKYTDWERLRRREIAPPYVPKFTHAADTSNFLPWGKRRNSLDHDKRHEKLVDYSNVFVNF